ncbi:MAG: proton-conducting membrane transporter [Defluviitaleaceae bacterium]|nr:proton-conducting membrane transporter [Defluviitaleaceae bacterium]MCL2836458.1 proton-conducting membrane transporter [Defluviitaleaceae bacterium]
MLAYYVIVPILTAILLYTVRIEKVARIIAIIAQTGMFGFAVYLFALTQDGEIINAIGNYANVMGIVLRADALSAVFVLLTAFVFLIAAFYSFNKQTSKLFWFLLFVWQATLIGIFLTGDLFNVFVLLEIATVTVTVLIMFDRNNRSLYDGMIYMMVNIVIMQFYLFGLGYIYKLTGVMDMYTSAALLNETAVEQLYLPYALLMTFVALKCALIPLFSWLPKAHGTPGAPSVVSAVLSGLHIKSGVYLFLRFQAVFQQVDGSAFFLTVGTVTCIAGFLMAMSQKDIKLILAYHTISQVGLIMIGLNLGGPYSHIGGLYHVINHAAFKAALFLTAGIIEKAYGTRNVYEIKGVLKGMPVVGAVTVMAVLGITGAPFFNGSISKYFIGSGVGMPMSGIMMFINLGTIISFIKYSGILGGKTDRGVTKPGKIQQGSVLVLGLLCLSLGLWGEWFIALLFNNTVHVDRMGYLEKSIIFAVTVAAGYFIFKYFVKGSPLFERIRKIDLSFKAICAAMGIFFITVLLSVSLL